MDTLDHLRFGGAWNTPLTRARDPRGDNDRSLRWRIASAIQRCRFYYRVYHYALGSRPALFYPIYAWREGRNSPHPVRHDTEVVIESYPRSGSTFAVHAFHLAQGRPVRMADHIHVPAQIMRAAKLGIPTCVLIRDPMDAVSSLIVKYPQLSVSHALKGYIKYYSTCLEYRDHFVVADFGVVTRDFGAVIDAINRRFGTQFLRFDHSNANVAQIFNQLDRRNEVINRGDILASYRPNHAKAVAKRYLDLTPDETLLRRARRLYGCYFAMACDVNLDNAA